MMSLSLRSQIWNRLETCAISFNRRRTYENGVFGGKYLAKRLMMKSVGSIPAVLSGGAVLVIATLTAEKSDFSKVVT